MDQGLQVLTKHLTSYLSVRTRSVMIDGQSWRYFEQGKGDEVCLFLHGVGGSILFWRSMMQSYDKKFYRGISPNIPGICLHQFLNNKTHSINQLSRWLDSFLAAVDAQTVNIVAHSTACCLGIHYAATRSNKVKTLTLLSLPDIVGPGKVDDNPVVKEFMADTDIKSLNDWDRYLGKLFYRPPNVPKSFRNQSFKNYLENRDNFLVAAQEFMPSISMVMTHMKRITCPVLAINAEHDPYSSPAVIETLDHHFRNIKNIRLRDAGHISFLEKHKEVTALHQNFLLDNQAMPAATVA